MVGRLLLTSNSAGFTLVEFLIGLSICVGVLFLFAEEFRNLAKSTSAAHETGAEFDVREYVLNSFDCQATISGTAAACNGQVNWLPADLRTSSCGRVPGIAAPLIMGRYQIRSKCRQTAGPTTYEYDIEFNDTKAAPGQWKPLVVGPVSCIKRPPGGTWVATWGGGCAAVCAASGMQNLPDSCGRYCTSGELNHTAAWTALGTGIYRAGCWNKPCNVDYGGCRYTGSYGGYCYTPTNQDGDGTDITAACRCDFPTPVCAP